MTNPRHETQKGEGFRTGRTPGGEEGGRERGDGFGASEPATRGTDRDADRTGTSKNQGHGHPREKRGGHHD